MAGRLLSWGPRWDCSDASLVFDTHSGDYWVLSPTARTVVEIVFGQGPQPLPDLLARVAAVSAAVVPGDDWEATTSGLVRSGLLRLLPADGGPGTADVRAPR